jgi:hypothetical protein
MVMMPLLNSMRPLLINLEPFKIHVAQEVHENHPYHVLQTSCATIFVRQTHSLHLTNDSLHCIQIWNSLHIKEQFQKEITYFK